MLRLLYFCLLLLVVGGCGSQSAFVAGAADPGPQQANRPQVSGRFFLGTNVAKATVRAEALDGRMLAQSTTDASGCFYMPAAYPPDFRLVATLPGSALRFTSEVRSYAGEQRWVVINVPNTLASEYLATQPGMDLARAESWASSQLALPPSTGLGWSEEGPRAAFSHLAFFAEASRQGGWGQYKATVLASSNPLGPYRLNRLNARSSTAGLEPALATVVRAAQTQPKLVATVNALRRQLSAKDDGNLITDFGGFLLGGAGGAVVSSITLNTLGYITTSVGWNVGTAGGLNEIQSQLTALQAQLTSLATSAAITNSQGQLSSYVNTLATLVSQQASAVQVATSNGNLSGLPGGPTNSNLTTVLSTLGGFQATTALKEFGQYMLGDRVTNLLTTTLKSQLANSYGIQQDGQVMPVRSGFLLDRVLGTFNYYAGQQALAANYLAEQSHPTLPIQTPAIQLLSAQRAIEDSAYSLALQRQQLPPYPISDNILIDLQNGIMWYTDVFAPATWSVANASGFTLTGNGASLGGWRLPTSYELQSLQNRGRYVANTLRDGTVGQNGSDSSPGNYGYTMQGLSIGNGTQGLGFTGVDQIDSDGEIWYADWQINHNNADPYWELKSNQEFRLNHESSNTDGESSDTTRPFLMVRSLGPELLQVWSQQSQFPSAGPYPPNMSYYNLTSAEFAGEGTPDKVTSVTLTAPSNVSVNLAGQTGGANTSVVTVQRNFLAASVNYQMSLGGEFHYGPTSQTSAKVNSATYTNTLVTGGSQGAYGMLETPVAFNVTSGNATVSNYNGFQGLVNWHTGNTTTPASQTATVLAAVVGASGVTSLINATASVTQATPPVAGLVSIMISPRNFTMANISSTGVATQPFFCTGYYADGTLADLTTKVTWNVVNNSTGLPNLVITNSTSRGVFFSDSTLTASQQSNPANLALALYNVTASLTNTPLANGSPGNISDSTYVQIGVPPTTAGRTARQR